MASGPTEWSERSKVIHVSLIVSGIIKGRQTNVEESRTLTLDQDLSIVASDDFLALGSP